MDDPADPISLLADLVRIDSVNPALVPGAAGEGAAVELLRLRLASRGFATAVFEAPGHSDRPSLLAWTPAPAQRTVLLNGHLDTVGVDGMAAPFDPVIEGDVMTGRGTCDMKGGCAALVAAAETLARDARTAERSLRIVLALVADEEDRSLGTEAVLTALPALGLSPEVAVVAEPTWLDLAAMHRGYAVAEVTFTGRAAHSSQPEQGVDAVAHLGRFLAAVEQAAGPVRARGGALMVTVVEGGSAPFTIAASARALVERRTMPGESAAGFAGEVEQILAGLATEADVPDHPDGAADSDRAGHPTTPAATVRLTHAREAWQRAASGPSADLAEDLAAALAAHGHPCGSFAAPYWMESALWEAHGIPTLVCGPAGGGLHAVDEWVSLDQVRIYRAALVEAILAWGSR